MQLRQDYYMILFAMDLLNAFVPQILRNSQFFFRQDYYMILFALDLLNAFVPQNLRNSQFFLDGLYKYICNAIQKKLPFRLRRKGFVTPSGFKPETF